MRIVSKITLSIAVASSIFFAGCTTASTVSEESLGLRNTNLYTEGAETTGDETKYGTAAAGSGVFIERAFENAPPMVPHSVEGMLPITIKNNSCVSCHAPEVATAVKATPYPVSHMTNYRPNTAIGSDGRITKEGKGVDNTSELKSVGHKLSKLAGSRFNCSQCHAPQSTGQLVENTFEADFRAKDGANRSNQVSNLMEGLNTIID